MADQPDTVLTVEEIDEWTTELEVNEKGSESTVMTRQWALKLLAAARKGIEAEALVADLRQIAACAGAIRGDIEDRLDAFSPPTPQKPEPPTPGDEKAGEGMDHPSGEREDLAPAVANAVKEFSEGFERDYRKNIDNRAPSPSPSVEGLIALAAVVEAMPEDQVGVHFNFKNLVTRYAEALKRMEQERDSWRRVAERCEGESQALSLQVQTLREALKKAEALIDLVCPDGEQTDKVLASVQKALRETS